MAWSLLGAGLRRLAGRGKESGPGLRVKKLLFQGLVGRGKESGPGLRVKQLLFQGLVGRGKELCPGLQGFL